MTATPTMTNALHLWRGMMENRQTSKSRSIPATIRVRRDLYEALPVEPAYFAGTKGAGRAGYLSAVLEEALIAKLGLTTAEVDAQAA